MEEKIFQKLLEHDNQFEKIDQHFEKIDQRFEKIDQRLDGHDKRFERIEGVLENHTIKLLEHDEQFSKIREEMAEGFRKVTNTLEGIVTIVQRLDQERIFTVQWVRRIEDEVRQNSMEIIKMKQVLKIA